MQTSGEPTPRSLPRGRHGLSRETVRASQRARLIDAIAEVTAERGYAGVTISEIVRRAGVAKSVFYEVFEDKLDCYLAAYDEYAAELLERIASAMPGAANVRERYAFGVRGFVSALADDPDAATAFIVEVMSAGRPAQLRRAAMLRTFAAAAVQWRHEARQEWPELPEIDELHAFGAVAAIHELLFDALLVGGVERVQELEPRLVEVGSALMPT